jgi:hypothetical protein
MRTVRLFIETISVADLEIINEDDFILRQGNS